MTKVFCVGANKTGTTSMQALFTQLGLKVAPQQPAELMLKDWSRRDFTSLVKFCRNHEAFQDIPFSLPFTFQALDQSFPESKFILTMRASADEWYASMVRFETKFMELDRLPTPKDLRACTYLHQGWAWCSHQLIWGCDESTLYDPARYKQQYERHNESVRDYFSQRPADLLVLDIADPLAVERVCDFLSLQRVPMRMPHLNRSRPASASKAAGPPARPVDDHGCSWAVAP